MAKKRKRFGRYLDKNKKGGRQRMEKRGGGKLGKILREKLQKVSKKLFFQPTQILKKDFNGEGRVKTEVKISNKKKDNVNKYVHPTQKPVKLAERALVRAGNIVIDGFGGSGSTLIGCEQLGRRCYAMELDPKYCDVIVKRWEQYTGRKAALKQG
jgi:DNA modification methylase